MLKEVKDGKGTATLHGKPMSHVPKAGLTPQIKTTNFNPP